MSMSFFDKNGISQTEATHLANQNAERVKEIEGQLNRFNPTTKKLITSNGEYNKQTANIEPETIINLITEKASLNRFSAWLREAVSQKTTMLNSIKSSQFFFGHEPPVKKPLIPEVDEDWAINQLNIKERATYLAAEAEAAAIGKYIHQGGLVSEWQHDLGSEELVERGQSLISCPLEERKVEEVNKIKNELFNLHRKASKTLNALRARIQKEVNKRNADIMAENEQINRRNQEELIAYESAKSKAAAEFNADKAQRLKEAAGYKIAIPEEFSVQSTD